MSKSKIFLYFCLSFIVGVFFSSFFDFSDITLLILLILGIILISVFWKYKKFMVAGFCILFLTMGFWRLQFAESKFSRSQAKILNFAGQNVVLVGIVNKEPDIKEKTIQLEIKIETINPVRDLSLNGVNRNKTDGKILIRANRFPEYQYGDKLKIKGVIEEPQGLGGFNYKAYLAKEGIVALVNWPEIELVGSNFGNTLTKNLLFFKRKFQDVSQKFLSPPQQGFLEALIFGEENNIPESWKEKLNLTGTRHIAAVSGMNITIITFLIFSFALNFGLWRQQAFYLSLFLILFYILMIGSPASGVRAGIMGLCLMLAQGFGRLSDATRAVVFAAVLMLLFNPFLLTFDLGFQLSFLAILGLIYFQPIFYQWFKTLPNPSIFPLRMVLSATLSAQIFTLPLLLYNFGRLSLISPLANALIVPFLAPITILIFIFGLSAIVFGPLGWFLSLFVWFSLTYIIKIVDLSYKIPFAYLSIEKFHWLWLLSFYLLLFLLTLWLRKRQRLKFLNY